MFSIGVYVTSRYKNYEEFKATLEEALKKYIPTGRPNAFCTGSFKSNIAGNGLVQRYAFENSIPCRVFETRWADNIPTKAGKKNTAGVRSNAMIIKNSNACIMFYTPTSIAKWDFMSGGCYNFQKMCGKLRRELIPIKIDIYKPIEKHVDSEEIEMQTAEGPIGNIGIGTRVSDFSGNDASLVGGSSESPSTAPVGSVTPPSIGDTPPTGDSGGDLPVDGGIQGGSIVDLPVDISGDGIPDTTISAIDTNGDGTPDSKILPVDLDGNGTIDKIDLSPITDMQQSQPTDGIHQQQPQQEIIASDVPSETSPQQSMPTQTPLQQQTETGDENKNNQ